MKLQSAMEFLTTYGWAILIIAVVIIVLFKIGVFNSNNFISTQSPGSCLVNRPYGPFTTISISLEGVCNGGLPQTVLQVLPIGNGGSESFSGGTYVCSHTAILNPPIQINLAQTLNFNSLSISWWALDTPTASGGPYVFLASQNYSTTGNPCLSNGATRACGLDCSEGACTGTPGVHDQYFLLPVFSYGNPPPNQWIFYTFTIDPSGFIRYYVNGTSEGIYYYNNAIVTNAPQTSPSWTPLVGVNTVYIGGISLESATYGNCESTINGSISNVQLYNSSLSQPEIQALYIEGIGGAPIDLNYLAGWWPLNGNANDYSGNSDNAITSNYIYISQWFNLHPYTAP